MKKIFKYPMMFVAALALTAGFSSCSDSNNDNGSGTVTIQTSALQTVNKEYVENTVIPTYRKLADYSGELAQAVISLSTDEDVAKAGDAWKNSRKWWEFSEAFLFGPAGNFSIDPHIDTWPFDKTKFNNYMAKYNPSENESDAEIIEEQIQTNQNLTGFHAVEYLLFRDGETRKAADITADEKFFIQAASADLYLNALKLVSAWGGEVSQAEQDLLDEAEFDSRDYGADFKNAGNAGSTYTSVLLASRQIIAGAQDIIGEVADSKIGSPTTGTDVNYIESPYSYNSIQDFYDNIMSCKHALYGGCDVDGATPKATSLIGVCLTKEETKALAEDVMTKMDVALDKISKMKKPFVLYYTDQTAHDAITALQNLSKALQNLDTKLEGANLN